MSILTKSIINAIGTWKVILIVYAFQLLLACTIGIQVYQVIEASIGSSLSLDKLMDGYDYTVVNDFFIRHGASISPLIGQVRWLIFVYFIFGIFLNAGILFSIMNRHNNWVSFFEGGAKYFFRFLQLTIIYVPLFVIWTALIWAPLLIKGTALLESLPNEKYYFGLLAVAAIIYIVGLSFIILSAVVNKIFIIKNGISFWIGVKYAFGRVWQNLSIYTGYYFLLLFFLLIMTMIYYFISFKIGMISLTSIIFMFIFQQTFVIFRIFWKYLLYNLVNELEKVPQKH